MWLQGPTYPVELCKSDLKDYVRQKGSYIMQWVKNQENFCYGFAAF